MTANPNLPTDTIILGDEYDDALRTALWRVLLDMDVELIDRTWGVGGSQEVETARIRIGEDLLTVESETYMGAQPSRAEARHRAHRGRGARAVGRQSVFTQECRWHVSRQPHAILCLKELEPVRLHAQRFHRQHHRLP